MASGGTAVLFTRFGLGEAPADLQLRLVASFLTVLADAETRPAALLFYTDGVKLICEGSPVIGEIRTLEQRGAQVLACGTCLDYFTLRDKVSIGTVAGMPSILDAMARADKVLSV